LAKYEEMIKVLVTGGTGQLGMELKNSKKNPKFNFYFPSSDECDLRDIETIKKCLDQDDYNLVLNLAAYTNVDAAETDQESAKLVNQKGVGLLAQETFERNLGLIHASTDYVFGGKDSGPYNYDSIKSPLNYYGLSKSNGEDEVLNKNKNCLIIRFSSLFSEYGNNFVKTMMRTIINNKDVNVVSDQMITMSYAGDFSNNIEYLIELFNENKNIKILHFANKDYATWFSVAKVIYEEIEMLLDKDIKCNLNPISSSDWTSKAVRPLDSRLNVNFDLLKENEIYLKSWKERVRLVVKKVLPSILNGKNYE